MTWEEALNNLCIPLSNARKIDFTKEFSYLASASFVRRMQDKAQVFPMETGDYVRTRLTHSIETVATAEELGALVSRKIIRKRLENLKSQYISDIPTQALLKHIDFSQTLENLPIVLKSAALIHDIGNPPFGHIGESIISDWFSENLDKFYIKKTIKSVRYSDQPINGYTKITSHLNDFQKNDLKNFEGNAQLVRILSKLSKSNSSGGYSAALYSACSKYTQNSVDFEANKGSKDIEKHKLGYFISEEDIVKEFQSVTTKNSIRNPLAFLLEASDDISYLISDIEDAIKKNLIDINDFISKLISFPNRKSVIKNKTVNYYKKIAQETENIKNSTRDKEKQIILLLSYLRKELINEVAETFISNENLILNGTYKNELLNDSKVSYLALRLRKMLEYYVYYSLDVAKQKTKVYKILNCLLDNFVSASFSCAKTNSEKSDCKNDIVCELISANYRKVAKERIESYESDQTLSKNDCLGKQIYECLRLAIDQISGMTDLYAEHVYNIIMAMEK